LIDMVIDPNNKKLYWTQYPYGDLYRANLDGSGIEMFAEIEANTGYWWTSPLAIDEVNNKIYYKPSDLAIYAIDLSTKIEEEIYTGNVHQYQIAVNPDKYIFWNQGNSDIYRANLDGSDVTFISSDGGNYPFITVDPANDEVYFTRQQGWGIEEWGILSSDLDFSVELIMENSLNNGSTTEWGIGYIGELALHTNLPTYVNTAQKFPDKFVLCQNYPNPFNPSTTIEYSIPSVGIRNAELGTRNDLRGQEENIVNLKIYDVLGREVATLVNEQQRPGNHEVQFNASGLVNGVYFYRLTSGKFVSTKKLVLLK
jgi:hypothetical protein